MKFKLGLLIFFLIFFNILFNNFSLAQNFPAGCVDVDSNKIMNEIDCGAPENEKCSICFGGPDVNNKNSDKNVVNSGPTLPNLKAEDPGILINQFYNFFLIIGGLLAFGAIVYGGIQRILGAGNPSKISDANEWIKNALIGLLLLFGAYIILNIINPRLVQLKLPTLKQIKVESKAESGSSGSETPYFQSAKKLSEQEAREMAKIANIKINANPPKTTLEGINIETLQAIALLKKDCNCYIEITGGTESSGGHNAGQYSHANGYKVDLSVNDSDGATRNKALWNYLVENGKRITRNNGGKTEIGFDLGNMKIYLEEGKTPHYDVVVIPAKGSSPLLNKNPRDIKLVP